MLWGSFMADNNLHTVIEDLKMQHVPEMPGKPDMPDELDLCDENCVHRELVEKVSSQMPDDEELYDLAEFYKIFGDSTRIRILFTLLRSPLCVCDLAEALGMKQPAVSYQLKILKQARLVKSRREGREVYYSLSDDHVSGIIEMGREHLAELHR